MAAQLYNAEPVLCIPRVLLTVIGKIDFNVMSFVMMSNSMNGINPLLPETLAEEQENESVEQALLLTKRNIVRKKENFHKRRVSLKVVRNDKTQFGK